MKPKQLDIFADALGDAAAGLPLFSNTPPRAKYSPFNPKPVSYQHRIFGRVTLEELQEAHTARNKR